MSRRNAKRGKSAQNAGGADNEIIREAFNIFDTDKDGYLTGQEIGTVIRALGKNPLQSEVEAMIKECNGKANVDKISELFKRKFPKAIDQDRDMRAAFEALDKDGNGTIMEAELRQILTTLGEPITHRELDILMRDIESDHFGNILYDKFVDKLVE